jgi:2,3-bisphosphoglycerate-dependent phosphoglycerate mutase
VRFIVIRHGQSTNNLLWEQTASEAGRHPDTPLTPVGHTQARLLGEAVAAGLLPWPIDVLYCSLMMRAVQTAAPLAETLDLPLRGHPLLFEVGGPYDVDGATGEPIPFPGSSASELSAASPRLVLPECAGEDGWYDAPLEPVEAVPGRAAAVVAQLREAHPDDHTVALVSHGYFSQFLFRKFLGIQAMTGWVEIHNASLTLYEDRPGAPGMRALRTNWSPHLPEQLVTL